MNEFSKLKSLAVLKKQRVEEEKAFEHLKKMHPHLSNVADAEILQFFRLEKGEDVVGYKVMTQKIPTRFDTNVCEAI